MIWDEKVIDEGVVDCIIDVKGLKQIFDIGVLEVIIDEVFVVNVKLVEEFCVGKEKVFNVLIGQVMKVIKGKVNLQQVNELLKKKFG